MNRLALHKALVVRYVEAFNRGEVDRLRYLFTEDAVVQGVLSTAGMDQTIGLWQELRSAFAPQLHIEEMVAEEDRVAVRYTERGTFVGAFRGHAPTGKSYELVAMEWFQIVDGRIHRRWGARDSATLSRQVGIPLS